MEKSRQEARRVKWENTHMDRDLSSFFRLKHAHFDANSAAVAAAAAADRFVYHPNSDTLISNAYSAAANQIIDLGSSPRRVCVSQLSFPDGGIPMPFKGRNSQLGIYT